MYIITHDDLSHVSKAFSGVGNSLILSVCDSVCVSAHKNKAAETKITKLGTGIVSHDNLAHQLILGQKVKGQGHKVKKCKKALSLLLELCTLSCGQLPYLLHFL